MKLLRGDGVGDIPNHSHSLTEEHISSKDRIRVRFLVGVQINYKKRKIINTNQLNLRTRYANSRRQGIYSKTNRVVWKTQSQHVA